MTQDLTHLDSRGQAHMVDVGDKVPMHRVARAEGFFCAQASTLDRLEAGDLPKGEALAVARIAGITGAKRCDDLIPLCHSLPIESVNVDFERTGPDRIRIEATATVTGKTGVEMEALTAVSLAALTLYDMVKAVDRSLSIEGISLLSKTKTSLNSP